MQKGDAEAIPPLAYRSNTLVMSLLLSLMSPCQWTMSTPCLHHSEYPLLKILMKWHSKAFPGRYKRDRDLVLVAMDCLSNPNSVASFWHDSCSSNSSTI